MITFTARALATILACAGAAVPAEAFVSYPRGLAIVSSLLDTPAFARKTPLCLDGSCGGTLDGAAQAEAAEAACPLVRAVD
jgi:hypothetical protein